MTKRPIVDFEETRAGFRSGEGADSVMHHLMAAAKRMQKRKRDAPDSRASAVDTEAGESGVDIPLPP